MSETVQIGEELECIINFNYGNLHMAPHRLWGDVGTRGRGLYFGQGAEMRLGNIFGWIGGMYQASNETKEFAEKCARDLFRTLDHLANYGGFAGNEEEQTKKKNPAYIVELYDDGTFHGFSLQWYRAQNWHKFAVENRWHDKPQDARNQIISNQRILTHIPYGTREVLRRPCGVIFPEPQYIYTANMNGAMLYRGPGKGETFSIDLGSAKDSLWGVHT